MKGADRFSIFGHHAPPVVVAATIALAIGCADDKQDGAPQWELIFDDSDLDATAFSVWGSAEDDVWIVGADSGDGPLVLHYDGDAWTRMDSGATGDLWWVSGFEDSVWMSGEEGLVLRYSRADDRFETFTDLTAATLFGIYPVAEDDVWAVGGDLLANTGVVLRFTGDEWAEVADVPSAALEAPLFKVWGRSSDDLWLVGFGSIALHRDGESWVTKDVPTGRRLLTVHGNDELAVAVGGFASGLVVEINDDELEDVTPADAPQFNGVWVPEDAAAIAGGNGGALWTRENGDWVEIDATPVTSFDYHSVFVDPAGGQWAVGGQIIAEPFDRGIVAHRGTKIATKLAD